MQALESGEEWINTTITLLETASASISDVHSPSASIPVSIQSPGHTRRLQEDQRLHSLHPTASASTRGALSGTSDRLVSAPLPRAGGALRGAQPTIRGSATILGGLEVQRISLSAVNCQDRDEMEDGLEAMEAMGSAGCETGRRPRTGMRSVLTQPRARRVRTISLGQHLRDR